MARTATAVPVEQHEDETLFETGDFEAILNRAADEITEPSKAPSGNWILRCVGTMFNKTKKEDLEANPKLPLGVVTFIHTPHEPLEGVNPDAVESGEWRGRKIYTRRNIKEAGDDFNVLKLVQLHGVDIVGRSLKEAVEQTRNRFVQGTVSVYSYDRKDTGETVTDNQIKNFVAVR